MQTQWHLKYYVKLEYKENKDYRHYRDKYSRRYKNFDNNLQHKQEEPMEHFHKEQQLEHHLPMEHLMHELQRWNDYSDHEEEHQTEQLVNNYSQNEIMPEMEYSSQDN